MCGVCAIHPQHHQSFPMSEGGFVLTREVVLEHYNKTEGIIRQIKLSVFGENTQADRFLYTAERKRPSVYFH